MASISVVHRNENNGIGVNWQYTGPDPGPITLVTATWDYILQESDFVPVAPEPGDPALPPNEFNKEYDLVGLTTMQAINLFMNKVAYANMEGNMGILTPNGAYSCSNAGAPPHACGGWSNAGLWKGTYIQWQDIPWSELDYATVPKYFGSWSIETQIYAANPAAANPPPPVAEWWSTSVKTLLDDCQSNGGPSLPSFAAHCPAA